MIWNNVLDPETKQRIIKTTEETFEWLLSATEKQHDPGQPGYCAIWATAASYACFEHDIKAEMIGGSANWHCNDDPGSVPTHVGHFWQGESYAEILENHFKKGRLPEMHCWVYSPEYNLIFDPSTRVIKNLAKQTGVRWDDSFPDPPDYLICKPEEFPHSWLYSANENATHLAKAASMVLGSEAMRRSIFVVTD